MKSELEKSYAVQDNMLLISDFCDFLKSKNMEIGEYYYNDEFHPSLVNTMYLIHEYFDIDTKKLHEERAAYLEKLRLNK